MLVDEILDFFRQNDEKSGEMTDDQDHRLIELLLADARMPLSVLAKRLGLARSTVQHRMRRLERDGIIEGYTLRLGEAWAGKPLKAHVSIRLAPKAQAAVEKRLLRSANVRSIQSVSGEFDLIVLIQAASTEALDRELDDIRSIEGVLSTVSSIILSVRHAR